MSPRRTRQRARIISQFSQYLLARLIYFSTRTSLTFVLLHSTSTHKAACACTCAESFLTTTVEVIYSFYLDFYLSIEISSQLNIELIISICPLPSHSSHETSRRSQTIKTTFCSCSSCAHKERRTSIYSLAFNHCVSFDSSSYLLLLFKPIILVLAQHLFRLK